jgi:hypothetical protein
MPELVIPGAQPEGIRLGMNSRDSAKKTAPEVGQLLENGFPALGVKPRNAMVDEFTKTNAIGVGAEHTLFRRRGAYFPEPDGSPRYFWAWSHNDTTKDEYTLERWDLTNSTRAIGSQVVMPQDECYFGFEKVYDDLLISFERQPTTVRSGGFGVPLTTGVSLFWDSDSSIFRLRPMMIDIAPEMEEIGVANPSVVPFSPRFGHATAVWNGALWVTGGFDNTFTFNDVWRSTDGVNWIKVLDNRAGGYEPRKGHTMLVYDNRLWVIGGSDEAGAHRDDVWYSYDGRAWVRATGAAAFGGLYNHMSVVYDNKMWVIGGNKVAVGTVDDVYSSTDGATWTLEFGAPGFGPIEQTVALVYDDKIWIVGLYNAAGPVYNDDIWNFDGTAWALVAAAPTGFTARRGHGGTVFNGKMWVAAGRAAGGAALNDVYSSSNGTAWTQETAAAEFTANEDGSLDAFDGYLYYLCGVDGATVMNQVFRSVDGATWTEDYFGMPLGLYVQYGFTFVRRTDSDSVLASIDDFTFRAWENYRGSVIIPPDEKQLVGTVALAGAGANNLTGVGTAFGSLAVDDYLRIEGGVTAYKITAIQDNTNATVVNTYLHVYGAGSTASRLPLAGEPIITYTYNAADAEGIEDIETRQVVLIQPPDATAESGRGVIPLPTNRSAASSTKHATHIRIFRTESNTSVVAVKGLTKRYVVDIPLDVVAIQDTFYFDALSSVAISGETNQLEVTGFSPPPFGRYVYWDSNTARLWIYGDPNNEAFAYCSTTPSDLSAPKKFASWFKPLSLYVTCGRQDEERATGMLSLGGDLYFFKEQSVYVLPDGDINQKPYPVSTSIGCPFPNTISYCNIPKLHGFCVLFLSDTGPAVLLPGGRIEYLHSFAIGELWPEGEVQVEAGETVARTWDERNRVAGAFHQNTYWIFYGDLRAAAEGELDTNKIFGYHFGDDDTSMGPLQIIIPDGPDEGHGEYPVNEPLFLVKVDNVEAYSFSHCKDEDATIRYRLTRWLKPGVFKDAYETAT